MACICNENLQLCSNEITLAAVLEEEQITIKTLYDNNDPRLEITPEQSKTIFTRGLVSDIIQITEKLDLLFSIKAENSIPIIVIREKTQQASKN